MINNIVSSKLPANWHHEHFETLDTTMEALSGDPLPEGEFRLVTTDCQTAGRGQRGTSWESEPGENLLFSFEFFPKDIKASEQFLLSEVTALAVAQTLEYHTSGITVKWPNDIYCFDWKIGGMLLEHRLRGEMIEHTLVGIGINLNQLEFHSDAPNPVSLRRILNREVNHMGILTAFVRHFEFLLNMLYNGKVAAVEHQYFQTLYRRTGFYPYRDLRTGEEFTAHILTISPLGRITLRMPDGSEWEYAFKELQFIL